jgi:hypothetical protein
MNAGPEPAEPVELPPSHMWREGRCVCCDRETIVAPGPQIGTSDNQLVTLPYCQVGFERALRYVHRVRMRVALYDQQKGTALKSGPTRERP